MVTSQTDTIRQLNDTFRTTFRDGRVVMTQGIQALGEANLNAIIAKHTGQSIEVVEKACDRDNFMSSEEAKAFGLVDEVVASRKDLPGLPDKSSVVA